MKDILPCPYCGSEKVRIDSWVIPEPGFCVVCQECQGEGPIGHSDAEALNLWNTRPTEAQS